MKLYICTTDEKENSEIIHEEILTEQYRRHLIKLLERGEDMQITINKNANV